MTRALLLLLLVWLNALACSDSSTGADLPAASGGETAPAGVAGAAPDTPADAGTDTPSPTDPWEGLAGTGPRVRDVLGVSSHMNQGPGDDALRTFELERCAELGGARVREDYTWSQIEPADDQWNFAAVDTQVDLAVAAGARLDILLVYGNAWATPDGSNDALDVGEYGEYAGALAARYCGRVDTYEVWNEEDLSAFWPPNPNPAVYARLLKAAYVAVKAACPGATVLFGGLNSMGGGDFTERWLFLQEAVAAEPDLCEFFDVLALHPYTFNQAQPPETDSDLSAAFDWPGQVGMVAQARERLAEAGCAPRPIWFTELGWPSYPPNDEAATGRFLARSVLLALQSGVEAYFVYTFWDSDPAWTGLRPQEAHFGLFGWPVIDGQPRAKPGWHALKALSDLLGTARFARDLGPALQLPNDVWALAFVDEAGVVTVAAWDGRELPDRLPSGTLPGGPDTSHDLPLPLPSGAWSVQRFDQEGAAQEAEPAASTVPLHLTPRVQYVRLSPR
jgi:hypothetical protein